MDHPQISTFNQMMPAKNKLNILKKIKYFLLLKQGYDQQVKEELLALLNSEDGPKKVSLEEINLLIDCGEFQESQKILKRKFELCHKGQEQAKIYFLSGKCYYGLGYLEEAIASLTKALDLQPGNSNYRHLEADCLLELGRWKEAVASLNKSLRSAPGDAETIFRMGNIFMFNGEYNEALNCFSGCNRLKPFNPEYWEMRAEMHIQLNQPVEACACFSKALRYGGGTELYTRLAYCYAKTDKIKKAKKLLAKILKQDPNDYDALCNLAGIYHKLDKNEQSFAYYKKAYMINSQDPELLNNLGFVSFQLGRSRKAIEYYHQALKINPFDKIVLYNLSVCLYEKGKMEESKVTLEKLLSIDSQNSNAWTLLGNVYENLSKFRNAVDCLNKSLGLAQ